MYDDLLKLSYVITSIQDTLYLFDPGPMQYPIQRYLLYSLIIIVTQAATNNISTRSTTMIRMFLN